MVRVPVVLGLCVLQVFSLRRSDAEQASGEVEGKLHSAFTQHASSMQQAHMDTVFRTLRESRGSNLTATLNQIIIDLGVAVGKVTGQVTSTSSEVLRRVNLFDSNVTSVSDLKGNSIALDNKWSSCMTRLQGNASNLASANGTRSSTKIARNAAQSNASSLKNIGASISLDTFECDASDHDNDCEDQWATWNSSARTNVSSTATAVSKAIFKYEEANGTWTTAISTYDNALTAMTGLQTKWSNNQQTCITDKGNRDTEVCAWFRAFEKKCTAKQAYDQLLLDINANNNVWSQEDRKLEYKSLQSAICILQKFVDDTPISSLEECTNLDLTLEPNLENGKYQHALGDMLDTCEATSFHFGPFSWTEPNFSPGNGNPDDEEAWTVLPDAAGYVKGTATTWNGHHLRGTVSDNELDLSVVCSD